MTSTEIVQKIKDIAIVPVVRTTDAESAIRAVEAIAEGGIACAEITMTVQGAIRALERVADRFGDKILLGAGTVLDSETARACMLAGANFFVTPSLNVSTIELAKRYSKPIFPGALTPTEVLTAWQAGADGIKVFPCSALGGAKYIRALKGPFPHIEFVPTGGVNLDTISDFLAAGCCAVGVGSELVDSKLIAEGNYDALAERARKFQDKVHQFQTARS
jgi:2-dehydro-3-deoxyphosphogluconate aldolase / (4S)-4-hydroxy-2-oxoglutarate aldolase